MVAGPPRPAAERHAGGQPAGRPRPPAPSRGARRRARAARTRLGRPLLGDGCGHPALGLVVLAAAALARGPSPRRRANRAQPGEPAHHDLEHLLEQMDRLALSPEAPVAALIRWTAVAGRGVEPRGARVASLRRYRRLLLHARRRRAGRASPTTAGHCSSSPEAWATSSSCGNCCTGSEAAPWILRIDDLPLLDALITASRHEARDRDDAKFARLRAILADGRATLVFSVSRRPSAGFGTDSVRGSRGAPASRRASARCGRRAARSSRGSAPGCSPRRRRLPQAGSRPCISSPPTWRPRVWISTALARVVHYDLPWTPIAAGSTPGPGGARGIAARGRRGRPLRAPAGTRAPAAPDEALARKAGFPRSLGWARGGRCGAGGASWQRISASSAAGRGVAAVAADPAGVLAGFTVARMARTAARRPVAAHLLWWDENVGWTEEPETLVQRLEVACACARGGCAGPSALRLALERIGGAVRERLRAIRRAAWESPRPGQAARALLATARPARPHRQRGSATRTRSPACSGPSLSRQADTPQARSWRSSGSPGCVRPELIAAADRTCRHPPRSRRRCRRGSPE